MSNTSSLARRPEVLALACLAWAASGHAQASLTCDIPTVAAAIGDLADVTQAKVIAATTGTPQHCLIQGTTGARRFITYDGSNETRRPIGFELRLPTPWNGNFFFQGGGGTDGKVRDATGNLQGGLPETALDSGYAVVSNDSGHENPAYTLEPMGGMTDFGFDFEARLDYARRSVSVVTTNAKTIINRYYGTGPTRSYFVGCSTGGRHALEAATKYSDQFDGILMGDPAIRFAHTSLQIADDARLMSTLAVKPGDALTSADMKVVQKHVTDACDMLDGAADGIVNDTMACQTVFKPSNMQCASGQTSNCLSAPKFNVLTKMMAGVRRSNGEQIYASYPWEPTMGTNLSAGSWRTWRISSVAGFDYSVLAAISGGGMAKVVQTPPSHTAVVGTAAQSYDYLKSLDIEAAYQNLTVTTPAFPQSALSLYNVANPSDLTAFKTHGKIIAFTGAGDAAVSALDIINWYKNVQATDKARGGKSTEQYARLYVIPGMGHCFGGLGTDRFNLFKVLVDWVENKGTAPIPSDANPPIAGLAGTNLDIPLASWSTSRQRPLCAYPKVARYVGSKILPDYVKASNFACQD
jgi:hypothetical protein